MDRETLEIILTCIFWYFFCISSFYIVLITFSIPLIYLRFREVSFERPEKLINSETLPYIGVVITLHNEGEQAVQSVHNALNLSYPNLEVIAVNDESDNNTFELLVEAFSLKKALPKSSTPIQTEEIKGVYRSTLFPDLIVVDKVSKHSKADATNAGINESNAELVIVVDADTIIEKDALVRLIRPFYDGEIAGEGGTLRILNGCTLKNGVIQEVNLPHSIWAGIQVAEYLRAFLYGRLGWNIMGGPLIISGAFGLFRRDAILKVGGFDPDSIGEDFELTARLHAKAPRTRNQKVIQFVPDPVAWTTAPETYQALRQQRIRWHQGLCEVLWKYKHMFFNPKYGWTGMVNFPYFFFGELVEPIVETIAYALLLYGIAWGYFGWGHLGIIFLLTWVVTFTLTGVSILLEITTFRRYTRANQIFRLIGYSILENILLRPAYLLWRYVGIWRYIRGKKTW